MRERSRCISTRRVVPTKTETEKETENQPASRRNRALFLGDRVASWLFNPYNIFNGLWSRFLSSLLFSSPPFRWPGLILFLLPLVLPRSVVPRLLALTLGAPLLPGIHFHAFSWAASPGLSLGRCTRFCPSFSLSLSLSLSLPLC